MKIVSFMYEILNIFSYRYSTVYYKWVKLFSYCQNLRKRLD